jgi:hypothetical protein
MKGLWRSHWILTDFCLNTSVFPVSVIPQMLCVIRSFITDAVATAQQLAASLNKAIKKIGVCCV